MGIRGATLAGATALGLAATLATTGRLDAAPPTSVTFDQPGAYAWSVPPGVKYATFDVYGASGGGVDGGQGAHVRATIPVQARSILTVLVGGRGGDPGAGEGGQGGAGGFGGGAPGGNGGAPWSHPCCNLRLPGGTAGAGGGGASDVRTGAADDSDLSTRLVVAGGGGGSAGAPGGEGSLSGDDGSDGQVVLYSIDVYIWPVPGGSGGGGPLGVGLPGQDGVDAFVEVPTIGYYGEGGGGGGGGLHGGGGGLEAHDFQFGASVAYGTSSGGGGGSSMVPSDSPCETVVEGGVQSGDGQVIITYRRGAAPGHICG